MYNTDGPFCPYSGKSCTRNLGLVRTGDYMRRIWFYLFESIHVLHAMAECLSPVYVQEGWAQCFRYSQVCGGYFVHHIDSCCISCP